MNDLGGSRRLHGVDMARLVAILGMFAAHIFPLYQMDRESAYWPTFTGAFASGRASVLFMVLAGVSLSLMVKSLERKGFSYPKIYSVLAVRASIIAVLGMVIGSINEAIAVILVHYGLLFLLLPLALKLSRITIWVVSGLWLLLMPLLWRPLAERWRIENLGHNPTFSDLLTPQLLFTDLTVTGYYPLLVWFGYGLLGIAIARCDLLTRRTAVILTVGGSLSAMLSYAAGMFISLRHVDTIAHAVGVAPSHVPALLIAGRLPGKNLDPLMSNSLYLWLPTGHSNSLLATLHAAACAVALIGLFLLISTYLGGAAKILAGAGRAPLTLYVAHIITLPWLAEHLEPNEIWWLLCAATACVGIWLGFTKASGPLEYGVRVISGADPLPPASGNKDGGPSSK